MTEHNGRIFRFAEFEVHQRKFSLLRGGETIPVEPKAFRVLVFLLENPHRLVTKEELLDAVWPDIAVSENSLTRSIALLRRLLGDDTKEPKFIATVPTAGYRFIASVQVSDSVEPGPPEPHTGYWGYFAVTESGIYLLDFTPKPTILYYDPERGKLTPILTMSEMPTGQEPGMRASRSGKVLLFAQGDTSSSITMVEYP